MYWCWLLGHKPVGPLLTRVLDEQFLYVYKCERCKKLKVTDERK